MAETTMTDEIEFDLSQLDDTLISDQQKQALSDYINQIKSEKRSINEDFNQLKLSTGQIKRRRTKRQLVPMINQEQHTHFQTMLETLIYIVHEINLEQVKLTTTINQLVQRMNQNEFYLNQLNHNVETFYEQFYNKQQTEMESTIVDEQNAQPIDMSTTKKNSTMTKNTTNKEYIELGDPSIGLSCLVLKRKYDQVRRRTELAYIHGEKRAIGRLLTFLIRQFFTNEELRNASLDGRVRNTQALAEDRMHIIDQHLQTIFGLDYNFYRTTKDCAEQVNVVCRHARNPKNFFEHHQKSEMKNTLMDEQDLVEEKPLDEYESFQEELYIQANDQRFHEVAQEYDTVQNELIRQREIESQLRSENEQLQKFSHELEEQLATTQQNEQHIAGKLESTLEQVRQLTTAGGQLKEAIEEQKKQNYELQKQRESLEEENQQVHNTNNATIGRLQELETTSTQLRSFESLWSKERQLYVEQIHRLEQSLVESKKLSIEQQTQIMQLTVQFESTDGQLQGQKRASDMGMDEKNDAILNLDRQLREKTQKIEQLQTDLQRTIRQMENQQITANKTIQSLQTQIDELSKKNTAMSEKNDEQSQTLARITSERDMIKSEMRTLSETFEKQTIENEQTIRRLQDELDNTTQLLESIRSKGADLTQLTNFLDGTLSHIRSNDSTITPPSTTTCSECRQLKSALVLELTGKERFRFGYEQLSSMIKEAAPILRRQKQDYEASFEVIAKLTSELNEARKELSELQHLSGESIENYRYIQRENQFHINDNKSLSTQIQVLLAEIEELRTGKRPAERERSPEFDPNQQVPITFRNVVELQHANQKLEKLVREMRAQTNHDDEDLNRTRFDELKKEHQQQQERLKETKNQLDVLENQVNSLIQERDFLRLLVSRSSSSQSTSSSSPSVDHHQVENLRDQVHRLQEKIEMLTNKNTHLTKEKDEQLRASNEKVRSIQYELLTARTEVEQANEKFNLINNEQATNRLTIASLRTEINGWQERHASLLQIRNKQEQQYFTILTELRELKDEKASLECRLSALENERKFDAIKYEQLENECLLLKSEIVKNEQIQPVIEKLQNLAEFTKEKTQAMFEAKLNDLIAQNEQSRQRIEQQEREKELLERTHQSRLDELTQNLQQEKTQHQEHRTKYLAEKEKAENLQRQLNEIENKMTSTTTQKTDIEQQLGDYEKQLKMLRVKLEASNNELELKQTLIQSGIDNANQLNINGQKAIEELEKVKEEHAQKLTGYEQEIDRLKQEIVNHQSIINNHEENICLLNERIQTNSDQHQVELKQSNDQIEQLNNERAQFLQQMESIEQTLQENEQLKEKITQLEFTIEQDQMNFDETTKRYNDLLEQFKALQQENQALLEQIQQADQTILQKDDLFKTQQDLTQQIEQRYLELEQKHTEQHALMIKLSTHLAAKESEATNSTDNETWNTILATNNYLRVENTRLADEVERIRLENAHVIERNTNLEQAYANDQEMIDQLKMETQSLQGLQQRFDDDQKQIGDLQARNTSLDREKQAMEKDQQLLQTNIDKLKQEKQILNDQVQQSQEKARTNDEQLTVKIAEIQRQGREMDELKGRNTKLESDNQELKQNYAKLRQIAIKYKATATAAATPAAPPAPTTAPTDADDLLTTGSTEPPASRPLPVDLTEKMNKLRDALIMARTTITAQQNRLTQMTSELGRVKQSRISGDQTETQALVESIRQTYETEINDLKHIIQLFDNTDSNEHMNEIVRLRKKIDELAAANKSSTSKQSEDATPKPTRPQAFASHTNQEPVISRVAPMAPGTGRRIGVAIPITASTTPTTSSVPLWTAAPTTETTPAQTAAPVEHLTTSQMTTAAGMNLLMKRTRTDDPDQRTLESTLKRTKAESETPPLIAHVEPQVREQQQQQQQQEQPQQILPVPDTTETTETSIIDSTRTEVILIPADNEGIGSSIEETMPTNLVIENDPQSNTGSAIIVNVGETTSTTMTTTNESANMGTTDQGNEPRRGDILPIIYDVQSIPTISSGGSTQMNRGGPGRQQQRPSMSISATRRMWPPRGPGLGRGGLGGRGAGSGAGPGPAARQ